MAILGYDNKRANFIRSHGLAEWLKARGLAGWLEIATDGLEESATQRIANEIEAHYAESVNAHVAAGGSEECAQTNALSELGDPKRAAAEFKKNHLTESEAEWMQRVERTAAQPLFSRHILWFGIFSIALVLLWLGVDQTRGILIFIALVSSGIAPHVLHSSSLTRSTVVRGIVLFNVLSNVAMGCFIALPISVLHYTHHSYDL
jgi:uncharacterized membrane protein